MKIGSTTIVWNAENFIYPHLKMLSVLDRNIVFMQKGPWPDYAVQHGISKKPDRTRQIITEHFPKVEIYESRTEPWQGSCADQHNQGFEKLRETGQYAVRLDTDMFFTKKDFERLLAFVRTHEYKIYRLDFAKCVVNYNGIGNFTGEIDSVEKDPIVVHNTIDFTYLKQYNCPTVDDYLIQWDDFKCHHFRGWKPNVTARKGKIKCPKEIQDAITSWMNKL